MDQKWVEINFKSISEFPETDRFAISVQKLPFHKKLPGVATKAHHPYLVYIVVVGMSKLFKSEKTFHS